MNCEGHDISQDREDGISIDAADVSGWDRDQDTSSFGCKEDNYFDKIIHLGGGGVGGVSCGNDVSTQTEERQESAETMRDLGSFLQDELEKYLENCSRTVGTQTTEELTDKDLSSAEKSDDGRASELLLQEEMLDSRDRELQQLRDELQQVKDELKQERDKQQQAMEKQLQIRDKQLQAKDKLLQIRDALLQARDKLQQ